MTRFGAIGPMPLVLVVLVIAACDIEFVAVDTAGIEPLGTVTVQSEHGASLGVHLGFDLPTDRHSVAAALGGEQLGGQQRQTGRWRYDTIIVADPARPDLHLTIRTGEEIDVVIPLLARGADAHRSAEGSLVIPLSYSEELVPAETAWEFEIVDSIGTALLKVEPQDGPVPNPVVLGRGIIPAGAEGVKVIITSRQSVGGRRLASLGGSSGRVEVLTHSTVHVPIP